MYYTRYQVQNASVDFEKCLIIPSMLPDFVNCSTSVEATQDGKQAYCFHGDLYFDEDDNFCPKCHCRMHIHDKYSIRLRHLCIGGSVSFIMLNKHRFICPECRETVMQEIPFKAKHHQITRELEIYTEELLLVPATQTSRSRS